MSPKPGKRWGGPWYGDDRRVVLFEGEARRLFHPLRGRRVADGREYVLTAEVPFYEQRKVRILIEGEAGIATVQADGPTESPHRYPDGSLCMWYPKDPAALKWVHDDGLLALIVLVQLHLFREAWWREYDEWPGPEIPHGPEGKVEESK